jgi:peptidoglycan-associated lipoprotein
MRSFMILCLMGFMFVACASKKEVKPISVSETEGMLDKDGLVLNGNSDDNKAGGLRTVHFNYESASLTASGKKILKENAEFLKRNESITVSIEGHCDERGGRQYNLALGERRAKALRDHLALLGISRNRIFVISYGNERPVVEGNSETSWQKNRRGSFVITSL